jgi:hypothetical protein
MSQFYPAIWRETLKAGRFIICKEKAEKMSYSYYCRDVYQHLGIFASTMDNFNRRINSLERACAKLRLIARHAERNHQN